MVVYQGFLKIISKGWKKFPVRTAEIAGQIFRTSRSANCIADVMLFHWAVEVVVINSTAAGRTHSVSQFTLCSFD